MQTETPAGTGPVERVVRPRVPKGVIAVLLDPNGRELANAAEFGSGGPVGLSLHDFQESLARRSLALATMRAMASPILSAAIDIDAADAIVRAMCNRGCRVFIVPVGYDE